jgi:large subunit ribosomal protein LX
VEKKGKGSGKQKKKESTTHEKPQKKKKREKVQRKTFIITGKFLMGDRLQKFQREVEARGEKRAREKIYQDMGSRHRVKRSRILIHTVEEAP